MGTKGREIVELDVKELKINKPGTLYALALCNIHGLWENAKEIKLSE